MKNRKTMLLAGLLLAGGSLLTGAAHAQVLVENVRVRLPDGQTISFNDGTDWRHDERVVMYHRYYYDPTERVYVVYNGDDIPARYHHDNGRHEGWKKHGHHGRH